MTGDTSLSETRRVVSGRPRGGCYGVDDGVEKASLPLWKRVRTTMSEYTIFSGFTGLANDVVSEKRKGKNTDHLSRDSL